MAFINNKVIIYGAAGVILALLVITLLPTQTETHIATGVNLNFLPEYGIQVVKISEEALEISNLVISIPYVDAKDERGEWIRITSEETQWDIRQNITKTIYFDQSVSGYSQLRFVLAGGIDKSYVRLEDGQVLQLGVSSIPFEVNLITPEDASEAYEIRLSLSQGAASNYILPDTWIEISTNKITGEIIAQ